MHKVRRAGQRLSSSWAATVTTGLSSVQYASLVVLAELGTCDQQTLGNRAGFDRATGSYLVERMVERGLIDAVTDPANRRSKLICLTKAGREVLEATIPEAKRAEAMLAERLSADELRQLKKLMNVLLDLDGSAVE